MVKVLGSFAGSYSNAGRFPFQSTDSFRKAVRWIRPEYPVGRAKRKGQLERPFHRKLSETFEAGETPTQIRSSCIEM